MICGEVGRIYGRVVATGTGWSYPLRDGIAITMSQMTGAASESLQKSSATNCSSDLDEFVKKYGT